ncbi:hypothetical protein [Aliiroseovarius sp. F20344]|uniref:hypothetical protein n=1 Tax=Aliiroseovarius sp. F20344 TaxID=2926414 RepID=UPI001FF497C9|nr:hypothetical protein [Aliiroseovarius sp. F20344]MCK0142218.1 hypothetical protein [Aliiroseovarius sp. F20344]
MKKTAFAAIAMSLVLSACEGHQYEPRKSGVSVSGESGFGVRYEDGTIAPHTETKVTVSLGGSI